MTGQDKAVKFLESLARLLKKHNVEIQVSGYEGEHHTFSIGDVDYLLSDDEWKVNPTVCKKAIERITGEMK